MQGIVFVPGISGSGLIYNNQSPPLTIWPPHWYDVPFGYQELDKLLDPINVTVGAVIDSVLGIQFYETTESDLRAIGSSINKVANGPYLSAPYDWRIDLLTAIDDLAKKIETFSSSVDEIIIVSHSMGGLLTRLLLEWKYSNSAPPAWFNKITRALFVCTPHLGAPTALARIFGLEVTEVVIEPEQMQEFAADPHFPAVYELLPLASRGILVDTTTGTYIRYDDPGVVSALGLSPPNLKSAARYQGALNPSKKPAAVKYVFVYGTGQPTDEGVNVAGLSLNNAWIWQDDQGDGTVPIWSIREAAALFTPNIQSQPFPGDHLGILTTGAFRQFLYSYFGLSGPAPLVEVGPGVVVSLNKRTYRPGETVHVLLIPDEETSSLSGSLILSRAHSNGAKLASLGSQQEIQFRGGPARSLPSKLRAPTTPGVYRLDFGGLNASHTTSDKVAGWFVVSGTR
jgi:phospholipase A1